MASSPKTLQELAASVGGKVKGDKVEYQVKGPGYKATRYIRLGEEANMNAYSSRPDGKGEVNGKNGTYGRSITPAALAPTSPADIPSRPSPADPGNMAGANNVSLAGPLASNGYSLDATGKYVYSEPKPEDNFSDLFSKYTDALGQIEMPNNTALYDQVEKDARIREKERAFSTYTNELNNITTKAQAESLALEGQGRGITESIIGGQQAKINREAAIQALPVQAKLAAAAGDLESARAYVTQKFNLLAQDAQQQYEYKTKLVDRVYDFANEQQQRQLTALQRKEDQAFQLQLQDLDFAQQKELATFKAGLESASATPAVLPPIVDPVTGKADPISNLTAAIASSGASDNVNLQNVAGVLSSIQAFAESNADGEFPGLGVWHAPFPAWASDKGKENLGNIEAINLKVQQWASGAALTEEQTKQVARFTPKKGDTYAQTRIKTNGLANFMLNQARGVLASQGVSYNPGTVDFFTSSLLAEDDLNEVEAAYQTFDPSTYYGS